MLFDILFATSNYIFKNLPTAMPTAPLSISFRKKKVTRGQHSKIFFLYVTNVSSVKLSYSEEMFN